MRRAILARLCAWLWNRQKGRRLACAILACALLWELVARPLLAAIWPELKLPSLQAELEGLLAIFGI